MIRTLLVDDFEDLLFIACKFLEKQAPDIELVTCESAKEALQKLEEEHFDIIVSDYQMPEMDGLEFLEVVRKSGNEIPFIIFTGRGREEVAIQALNLGATHYLKKGGEQRSQFAELAHHIRTAVSHRESEIALLESEGRYRSLFEDSAVSLWEEDFSGVKKFFDEKRTEGVTDFREYFENHPEDVEKCVGFVIVKDVNKASLIGQGVTEKQELLGPLESVFSKDALDVFKEEIISLAAGNTLFKSEVHQIRDVAGRKHAFIFQLNVPPGYEDTLAKVYLSIIDVTERYQSERLAEQESKKAQTYLELSSVMFVALDEDGIISFVNSHTCTTMGYEEDELLGKDWFELAIPESIRESVRDVFSDLILGKIDQVDYHENIILTNSGEERFIAWHNTYLTDESGKINGVLSSGEDITERKLMGEALRESEEALRFAFEESAIGMIWVLPGGQFKRANQAFCDMIGYSEDELLQMKVQEITYIEDYHIGSDTVTHMLLGATDRGIIEKRHVHKDGSILHRKMTTSLIRDTQGNPIHYSTQVEDVTEQKAALASLRESEAKLRSITENSPGHIMLLNTDGKIMFTNRTFLDLKIEDVLGESVYNFTPQESLDVAADCIKRVLESREPDSYLTKYIDKDKNTNHFEVRVGPVIQDEKVVALVINSLDITERMNAMEKLTTSEERYRLVLGSMNNPIFVFDKENCYREIYASHESQLAFQKDNMLGKHLSEVIPSYNLEPYLEILTKVRETGVSRTFEYSHGLNGQEQWYLSTLTLHEDGESVVSVSHKVTDKKKSEQTLKESEERYRLVLGSMKDLIFVYDKDDCYSQVYASDESLLIEPKDDILGKHVSERMPPHLLNSYLEHSKKVRETGESIAFDYSLEFDGKEKWFTSTISLHKDNESIVATIREITERIITESALKESEEKYRSLFENMPTGYAYCKMVTDEKGHPVDFIYLEINKLFEKLTGLKKEDVVGKKVTEAIPGIKEQTPELFDIYGKVSQTGAPTKFEIDFTPLDIWLDITVYSPKKGYFVAVFENITDRKRAELALVEKEEKWRSLTENSPDHILTLDRDLRILFANRASEGLTIDDLIGTSILDFLNTGDRPRVKKILESVLETGESTNYETEYKLPDNSIIYYESRVNSLYAENKIIGLTLIARDITERKLAADTLAESERLHKEAQSLAHIGHWRFEVDTKRVFWSDELYSIFEIEKDEVPISFEDFLEHIHPDDRETITGQFEKGESYRSDYRIVMVDGSVKHIHEEVFIEHADDGTITTMRGTAQDITNQKQAEISLKQSEERYRGIFNNVITGLARTRIEDGKILFCNDALARILGYVTPDEVINDYVTSEHYIDPEFRPRIIEELQKRGETRSFIAEMTKRDGTRMWVEFSSKINEAEGYFDDVVIDVTERIRAEEELRKSEEKYRTIVQSMSNIIFIHDKDDYYTDVYVSNDELLTGPKSSFIGHHPSESSPPELLNTYQVASSKVRATGEPESFDYPLILDGEEKWFTTTLSLHEDGEGIVSVAREITEKKLAENALRESDSRFKTIVDGSFNGIFIHADGKILEANQMLADMLGCSIEALIDTRTFNLVTEESRELITKSGKLGESTILVIDMIRNDGSIAKVESFASPCVYHGRDARIVAIRDITNEVEARDALEKSEAQKESILRVAPVGIGVVTDRVFTYVSETLVHMLGYSRDELLGKNIRMVYASDDEYNRVGTVKYEQIAKYGTGSLDTRWVSKDGKIIDVDLRSTPIDLNDLGKGVTFTALDISTRIRAASAVSESEEKYRLLIDSMEQGILILQGLPPRVAYANKAIQTLTGYTPEELTDLEGNRFVELFHQENKEQALETITGIIDGSIKSLKEGVEHEVFHKDGGTVWLLGHPRGIMFKGQPAFRQIFVDVTGRKEAERKLKRTQTLLNAVIEQSPFPMLLTGIDGKLEIINEASRKQLETEHRPSFQAGKQWEGVERPQRVFDSEGDEIKVKEAPMACALRGERTVKKEFRIERMDGTTRWEEIDGLPIYDDEGNVIAGLVIFPDITQRKLAEEELQTSEEMFRIVTGSMREGILIVDQDRKVRYTNKVYETMWRIPEEIMETKDDVKILEFVLDQLPDPLNYLEKVGDLYNSQDQSYNTILLKDGRVLDRYSFPIMSEKEVKGRAWIFRDISDEVSIDTKIKKEREALSNFAHRMSHELKNALIAIGGHACLLEDEHSQESIDAIKALVEKASNLMSRSVLLADAGLIIGQMSKNSLDEILEDALSEMILDEIKIETDALPSVKCDRMKITQVIRNILQNALEHGDAKKFEIRVEDVPEGRCVLFKNDGKPIPDEQHHKIFTEGFTTKKGGGIGLGIVKKIVEAHGWTISLDKGATTCFRIYIPSPSLK